MNRTQNIIIAGAVVLFSVLYFGFDRIPDARKKVERSRAIEGETTSIETLIGDAREHLASDQAAVLAELEKQAEIAGNDRSRADALKKLSGQWFRFGQPVIAGGYAEEVANIEQTDTAWSVAGATYFQALLGTEAEGLRDFAAKRARQAFENAASLNTENPEHRVNLALVYAENPPPDNPMQAVLMLRELESKYPDHPAVYNALGRLAIKTGQWERAVQRLEKAYSLDPNNPNTPCLLVKAYQGTGNNVKAAEFSKICEN